MKVPRFDIFSGTDKHAQWIEVVEGLAAASRRMVRKTSRQILHLNCTEHTIADSKDTSFRYIGKKYDFAKAMLRRRSQGSIELISRTVPVAPASICAETLGECVVRTTPGS